VRRIRQKPRHPLLRKAQRDGNETRETELRRLNDLIRACLAPALLGVTAFSAAQSALYFDFNGLPGQMTVEQAVGRLDGLACAPDPQVPALVRCRDFVTTYLGKPAILRLEFIDGTLSALDLLLPARHFRLVSGNLAARYGDPARHDPAIDGTKTHEHMQWTLTDGVMTLDGRVARPDLADARFGEVLGLKFLPSAQEQRRAGLAGRQSRDGADKGRTDN
jgi:hypothetical protein